MDHQDCIVSGREATGVGRFRILPWVHSRVLQIEDVLWD
jgi:hypothetical protein